MIKLIFTSAILVGSLFFFQSGLITKNQQSAQAQLHENQAPVQAVQSEPEVILNHTDEYVEIQVKVGENVKVIRQYYHCNT